MLDQLIEQFEQPGHGLCIREIAGGFKMATWIGYMDLDANGNSALLTRFKDETGIDIDYEEAVNDNPSWMDGQRTMWDGYGRSVNTYFVWLEERVGPQNAVAMAADVSSRKMPPWPAERVRHFPTC